MQNEITELQNQVRTLKRTVCLVCCLFGVLMFPGCEEKPAPQTQSPTSQAPPASPIPQVDETQLAKSFAEFADVYTKRMQESRNEDGTRDSWWTVDSIDIERTQSILSPYRGKLNCKIVADMRDSSSTEWRYSPSFNYVDGSWMFESAKLVVTRKGTNYSERPVLGKNLTETVHDLYKIMSKIVCRKIKDATP